MKDAVQTLIDAGTLDAASLKKILDTFKSQVTEPTARALLDALDTILGLVPAPVSNTPPPPSGGGGGTPSTPQPGPSNPFPPKRTVPKPKP